MGLLETLTGKLLGKTNEGDGPLLSPVTGQRAITERDLQLLNEQLKKPLTREREVCESIAGFTVSPENRLLCNLTVEPRTWNGSMIGRFSRGRGIEELLRGVGFLTDEQYISTTAMEKDGKTTLLICPNIGKKPIAQVSLYPKLCE